MATYKKSDNSQGTFILSNSDNHVVPGAFEDALHYLIDNKIVYSVSGLRYQDVMTGPQRGCKKTSPA